MVVELVWGHLWGGSDASDGNNSRNGRSGGGETSDGLWQ